MISRLVTLFCVVGLVGCAGPFFLIPGGALEGPVVETPAEWGFSDAVSTVQVETRPEDPYSVNVWAAALDEYLYLHAGDNRTEWVEHLEVNPFIRVAMDGSIYELTAVRVVGAAEFGRFAEAYEMKYGFRPRNENIGEIYVYRLGPR
jgi:hypothetical protein